MGFCLLAFQIVGVPMGTNCAPLAADLFFTARDSLNHDNRTDVIEAFIIAYFYFLILLSTSRYLDGLLNIDHPYFEGIVTHIYPPELQLNKANTTDTEAPFLDLHILLQMDLFRLTFMINGSFSKTVHIWVGFFFQKS